MNRSNGEHRLTRGGPGLVPSPTARENYVNSWCVSDSNQILIFQLGVLGHENRGFPTKINQNGIYACFSFREMSVESAEIHDWD